MSYDYEGEAYKFIRDRFDANTVHFHSIPDFDVMKIIRESQMRVIEGCKDKEASDLSEDEKFAICYFAGVDVKFSEVQSDPGKMKLVTAKRCGIIKVDGKFRVFEEAPQSGQFIRFRNFPGCGKET